METKLRKIIKEIKNLENSLSSSTRNEKGSKLANQKKNKIDSLIEDAKNEGLLTEAETEVIQECLNEQAIKLVLEALSGKIGYGNSV